MTGFCAVCQPLGEVESGSVVDGDTFKNQIVDPVNAWGE